jgi:MFS family permease
VLDQPQSDSANTDPVAASGPARHVSLWRNRDYLSWFTGTAFSYVGSYLSAMAFPLLVLFSTGSVLSAGVIASTGRIGILISSLWGGALADRVSRRLILVVIPLGEGVAMGVVTWSVHAGHVHIPLLSGVSLVQGMLVGVQQGATLPAMRRIVPRDQLAERAAQEQGLNQAAMVVGSPLAAILFTAARWLPFAADAVSFLFASAGAALIRRPLGPDRRTDRQPTSVLSDIRQGLAFVRRSRFLRYMAGWISVTNMVGNSFLLMLVALLQHRGAQPRLIGFASSATIAAGIISSLVAGRIIRRLGAHRVFLIGGWTYVVSLLLAAAAQQPWTVAATACLFVFAAVPTASVWEAYTTVVVPDELIGRVGAVFKFASQSLVWVGLILVGWLADLIGAPWAVVCFAALLVPFAVAGHLARSVDLLRTPIADVAEL